MTEFKFRYIRLNPNNDIVSVVDDVRTCLLGSLEGAIAMANQQIERYIVKNSTLTVSKINNNYKFVVDAPHLYAARETLRDISRKLHEKDSKKYPHGSFFNDCLTHEVVRE